MASHGNPAALWAIVALAACSRVEQPRAAAEVSPSPGLLPREAYLVVLDSALGHVRRDELIVMVDGAAPFLLTRDDLRARQSKRGSGSEECPPKSSIWFDAPRLAPDGRIVLHVVEARASPGGWMLGHLYLFRCTDGACRLADHGVLEEDFLRTCGHSAEFGFPPPNPLTND
jgi:hypothetical protein